jgi:iron complex transport system substrate-binding protein
VAGAILRDMGFVNLADANSLLCEGISMEAVLIEDPDYIFVVLQGDGDAAEKSLAALTENPAWATLTAVREGRIYMLDRELFHYHPNARWAEAYAFVLDILEEK